MTLKEALNFLEIDKNSSKEIIIEQYRWFIKTYHPDNQLTGDVKEFLLAIEAFNVVKKFQLLED